MTGHANSATLSTEAGAARACVLLALNLLTLNLI